MDLDALDLALRDKGAILTDPRILRRVIKRHRRLPGLGLQVPHARCYAISRAALLSIAPAAELGVPEASLPADVILLPRPRPEDLRDAAPAEVLGLLWRLVFHARVHLEIQRRIRAGTLTRSVIRGRIHRLGETEFDEVRRVLRSDELLLPPHDDREAYAEFAALYLELRHFSPDRLRRVFPTLSDLDRIDAALAADVDAPALLEETRPEGAVSVIEGADDLSALILGRPAPKKPASAPPPSLADQDRSRPAAADPGVRAAADRARARGNSVRSALTLLAAGDASGERDLEDLAARLAAAIDLPDGRAWVPLFTALARRAGPHRRLRNTVEARLLYDLQRAAVARERTVRAVDVVTWAISLGRRPVVRALPATTSVRVLRYLRAAAEKAPEVRVAPADRARLIALIHEARERAAHHLRAEHRSLLHATLRDVGLSPRSAPERVALAKVTEELLDQVEARGFLGIGHLRDALSKNQLKLPDLSGPGELVRGDPLLAADRRLKIALDGVYRGGEIYLRNLQRASSLGFGTAIGRFLTRYIILPFGAAAVILEGVSAMASEVAHLLHHHVEYKLLHLPSLLIVGAVIFGALHSAAIRAFVVQLAAVIFFILAGVFYRAPRFFFRLPVIRRIVRSRAARFLGRFAIKPAALTAAIALAVPRIRGLDPEMRAGAAVGIFLAINALQSSRLGALAEELLLDWVVRNWRILSRKVIPGLFRLVADFFRTLLELGERGIYRVDEVLRFRTGDGRLSLVAKAALGILWAFLAYIFRIYLNLFIEPSINPIKHFPVVTVAAKVMAGFTKPIAVSVVRSLAPSIHLIPAALVALIAVASLPGVFGFLVWELKENWKLYRATRKEDLRPVQIGHHGETMGDLMKPGFHSGTLPKLYTKLRRAARRESESVAKHEEALHEVAESVHRFVDRELCALLAEAPRFRSGPVEVDHVRLGSNRVRIELACPALSADRCSIDFEEQSGSLLASVPVIGFIARLPEVERQIFENALAGLHQLAGVDLVREQVEAELRRAFQVESAPPYDVSSSGLVVWPVHGAAENAYRTEVIYRFDGDGPLVPVVRGVPLAQQPPRLDREAILAQHQRIRWADWIAVWEAAQGGDDPIPRAQRGVVLLRTSPGS